MAEENKNSRRIIQAKIDRDGINESLKYTDLMEILRKFGKEKSLGIKIYRSLFYIDAIYGSKPTIDAVNRFARSPISYDFMFKPVLSKDYAIKFFKVLYDSTQDENYLYAINEHRNSTDKKYSDLAYRTLEIIGKNLDPTKIELNDARKKVNSIVNLIKNSSKVKQVIQNMKGGNK